MAEFVLDTDENIVGKGEMLVTSFQYKDNVHSNKMLQINLPVLKSTQKNLTFLTHYQTTNFRLPN